MPFVHNFVDAPVLERIDNPETGYRAYKSLTGKIYPSVTTVLKELPNPALDAWRKRVGKKKAERIGTAAADRGSALHKALESHLMNEPRKNHPLVVQRLFNQVWPVLNAVNNIRLVEKPLYSDRLVMAGTPDCIADYCGVLSVLDFKTSTGSKKEDWITGYFAQAGAYSIMYEELYGVMPQKCVILIAVENEHLPQVFVKDSSECFSLLRQYANELIDYRRTLVHESQADSTTESRNGNTVCATTTSEATGTESRVAKTKTGGPTSR